MAINAPEPDSDLQFVARMLAATRRGDQVNSRDAHRLDEIAHFGYTKGTPMPGSSPSIFPPEMTRAGSLR